MRALRSQEGVVVACHSARTVQMLQRFERVHCYQNLPAVRVYVIDHVSQAKRLKHRGLVQNIAIHEVLHDAVVLCSSSARAYSNSCFHILRCAHLCLLESKDGAQVSHGFQHDLHLHLSAVAVWELSQNLCLRPRKVLHLHFFRQLLRHHPDKAACRELLERLFVLTRHGGSRTGRAARQVTKFLFSLFSLPVHTPTLLLRRGCAKLL
mmetsp:Transcript_7236/g.13321  ORF Transcript_7236/g.13321 Transcript_7236/m.13321 type:complete len:208 (+) Transcript_7236:588-1211(+)